MRFLRKKKINRTILVISDIHLGAGAYVDGQRNYLEDFHHDEEMVEFLEYYSTGDYLNREVELVINGDLFDLLAVPYVSFYDDEYWSEEAALEKLKMIIAGHPEVIEGFGNFISKKNKKITFIIGNHDAEFVLPALQKHLLEQFSEIHRSKFDIKLNSEGEYFPVEGVLIKHGHEYEVAHYFHPEDSLQEDESGRRYFIPPWGSYYVTRIINKFKEERSHVNAVRPIKRFIINGFIYDPLFTIRFGLANAFYFLMVRFIHLFKLDRGIGPVIESALAELELWRDYEQLTQDFIQERDDVKALIVGHTHDPIFRPYADGSIFINTGTWMKMYNLDFGKPSHGAHLTYAQIDVRDRTEQQRPFEHLEIVLNEWQGVNHLPFQEFG